MHNQCCVPLTAVELMRLVSHRLHFRFMTSILSINWYMTTSYFVILLEKEAPPEEAEPAPTLKDVVVEGGEHARKEGKVTTYL